MGWGGGKEGEGGGGQGLREGKREGGIMGEGKGPRGGGGRGQCGDGGRIALPRPIASADEIDKRWQAPARAGSARAPRGPALDPRRRRSPLPRMPVPFVAESQAPVAALA